jgi:hypothetical protein
MQAPSGFAACCVAITLPLSPAKILACRLALLKAITPLPPGTPIRTLGLEDDESIVGLGGSEDFSTKGEKLFIGSDVAAEEAVDGMVEVDEILEL